ncbi:lipoyl domain-containing protein [Christensenellaceae bacterium OttesenSCG-928-K19]|nr:lipoyl domain-containing protein [Christensenellaceae bacterium OttesenSCG-928-K19]
MFVGIKMPKLSEMSDDYKIIKIRRKVGDQAVKGEIFMDVETEDKAAMEVAFYTTGVITELNVKEGDIVRGDALLGVINEPD